jgi:predicted ABC-type ATPase
MPHLIIIAGANGAGKTSAAPVLLRDTLQVSDYVNADTIAQGLCGFAPDKAAFEAGRIMLTRIHQLANERMNFAFETTLASKTFAAWVSRLKKQGYYFHLAYLWLENPELAILRVAERVSWADIMCRNLLYADDTKEV